MPYSVRSLAPDLDLAPGGLHEFYAAAHADAASLSAVALVLGCAMLSAPCLWVRHDEHDREAGAPCPAGLLELGISPTRVILVRAHDPASALQAALEGARCTGLGAVVVDLWGEARPYDLTASRRLALTAKASGLPVLMARVGARPAPSAAETRWQARAAPSRALAANAPGLPAFEITLLRARNGREGLRYCLEWDRDARKFVSRSLAAADHEQRRAAPLSGAVVPVPFDRQGPPRPTLWRHAG